MKVIEAERWDIAYNCTRKKEIQEKIKTAKVVTEYEDGKKLLKVAGGGYIMHDPERQNEAIYGVGLKCEGEFNEENLAIAKEKAIESLIGIIREVIDAVPDEFFVIHDTEAVKDGYRNPPIPSNKIPDEEIDAVDYFMVGIKIKLPNVDEGKEDIND